MINKAYDSGGESRGDGRVVVDASRLGQGNSSASPTYLQAVGPSVVYSDGQTVYVPHPPPPPTVQFEQRCICAPKTPKERKLFIAVIVLLVTCCALLATLLAVLPVSIKDDLMPDFVKRPIIVAEEIARMQAEVARGAA